MQAFLATTVLGFFVTIVGSFLCLLLLSYLGMGFGFGSIPKDLLKLAGVSLIVALIEGAWTFSARQSLAFNLITAIVHGIVLALFFFGDLSFKEAVIVGVACQLLYVVASVTIFVASQSTAYNNGVKTDWCTLAALVTPAAYP